MHVVCSNTIPFSVGAYLKATLISIHSNFKMWGFISIGWIVIKSKALPLIFISSAREASSETKIHWISEFRYRLLPHKSTPNKSFLKQGNASFLPNTKRILMKLENFLLTKVSLESEGFGRLERRLISQLGWWVVVHWHKIVCRGALQPTLTSTLSLVS